MVQAKRFGACGAASPHYVTIDFMNDNVKVAVPEYLVLIQAGHGCFCYNHCRLNPYVWPFPAVTGRKRPLLFMRRAADKSIVRACLHTSLCFSRGVWRHPNSRSLFL
jgi:hypothetical protein